MKRLQLPDEYQVNTVEQGRSMQLQQLALHIKPAKSWLLGEGGLYSLMETDAAEYWLADYLQQKAEDPETYDLDIKIYPAYNLAELTAMLAIKPTFLVTESVASTVIGVLWQNFDYALEKILKRYEKLCTTPVDN